MQCSSYPLFEVYVSLLLAPFSIIIINSQWPFRVHRSRRHTTFWWGAISHCVKFGRRESLCGNFSDAARVRRTSVCSAQLCNSHSEVHFRGGSFSLSLSTSPVWMHPHSRHHSSSSCALEFSSSVLVSKRGCRKVDINLLHLYKVVRYPD